MDKHKRFNYTAQSMKNAIDAVKSGTSVLQASKMYKVPRTTLIDKVNGRSPLTRKVGPDTVLTAEEEQKLVDWILHIGKCGFPPTKNQLLDSVQILLKNLKRENPFTNGRPGRHWYESFFKRHEALTERIPQNLTSSRANVTEEKIRKWFTEVKEYLETNYYMKVFNDPSRVFNTDETALFLSPKGDKVIVKKGDKTAYTFINNDEKECITSLMTCSAMGIFAPPMIIFSYKRLPRHLIDSCYRTDPQWGIGRSDSGWMTGETFYEYIANIFHPWLLAKNITLPVILFLDGHKSHLTMALSQFCASNGIILISLFPNSTHILQPLDVAVFRPLKGHWKKCIQQWRLQNDGKRLSRDEFATILKSTINAMEDSVTTIKNGFRACGLVPFNPDNIKYEKYFKPTSSTVLQLNDENRLKELTTLFTLLEKEIPGKINSFKTSTQPWKGAVEDTSLFELWYSLRAKIERTEPATRTDVKHITAEDDRQEDHSLEIDITEEFDIANLPIFIDVPSIPDQSSESILTATNHDVIDPYIENREETITVDVHFDETHSIENREETITVDVHFDETHSNLNNKMSDNSDQEKHQKNNQICETNSICDTTYVDRSQLSPTNEQLIVPNCDNNNLTENDISVPTPFKKSLFWPEPKKEILKKKRRDKVPAVATSTQWQDYYNKKEEKKKEETLRKEKNKEERTRKKQEREKNKSIKTKTTKYQEPSSSSEDEDNDNENSEILLNEYVIVNYNDQPLPGQIIRIEQSDDGLLYEVSHLEKKGVNWKWPNKKDILIYEEEEIVKKIKTPSTKNKRGLLDIPEMSDFI